MTGTDYQICRVTSLFKIDESFTDDRFLRVRLCVMHSGENLNHSSFSTKVIKDAKDSFANIPILANIVRYTDDEGNEHIDFAGHDAHIEEDAFHDGQYKLIYEEQPIGIIPETNNFEIKYDDATNRDYVYVDGYVYVEYGNYAKDIIESRGGQTDLSAEIYTDEIAFDAKNNVIVVNKMRMAGVTLLGADTPPAMKGANATVFSIGKDELQKQMIKVMSDLKESLDKYTQAAGLGEYSKEGGNQSGMNELFNKLLEKYGKTAEDITFEYEGLTDEELTAAFADAFEESAPDEEVAAPVETESADESEEEEADAEEEADEDEESADEEKEELSEEEEEEQNFAKMSVNFDGNTHEFSLSLNDKLNALYTLINNTYADEDGTWYDVTVYDEEHVVVMVGWNGKGYKQSYKVKKDVYTLVGDRVEVFATWLTQDEINKLDKMKSDYSDMSEKLTHYEDEPKKMEILTSNDYSLIADNEEFVSLCEQDNHFNMSVEEVTAKADAILTAAAKKHEFSVTDENKVSGVRPLPAPKKKAKRFGSLFDGII